MHTFKADLTCLFHQRREVSRPSSHVITMAAQCCTRVLGLEMYLAARVTWW